MLLAQKELRMMDGWFLRGCVLFVCIETKVIVIRRTLIAPVEDTTAVNKK